MLLRLVRVTIGSTADRELRAAKWQPFRAIAVNRDVRIVTYAVPLADAADGDQQTELAEAGYQVRPGFRSGKLWLTVGDQKPAYSPTAITRSCRSRVNESAEERKRKVNE